MDEILQYHEMMYVLLQNDDADELLKIDEIADHEIDDEYDLVRLDNENDDDDEHENRDEIIL